MVRAKEHYNKIGKPWTLDHRPFILRKWTPQVRMEPERLSSIPLWIRLPNLPLHLWEEDCLSRIGSLLGVPLYADSATLRCSQASYARICVEVQASTPLPDSILVEIAPRIRESLKVDYDWKPHPCNHCQNFGHDEACCVMKPNVAAPNMGKGGKVVPVAISTKGEEKVTSQWVEVSKSNSSSKEKLLVDAMKSAASSQQSRKTSSIPPNKFDILQDILESDELTIEEANETVQTLTVTNSEQIVSDPVQAHIETIVEDSPSNMASSSAKIYGLISTSLALDHAPQNASEICTISLSADDLGSSQKIQTRSQTNVGHSQHQDLRQEVQLPSPTPHDFRQSTKQSATADEVFPPSFLFESPILVSELQLLPKLDIPLEIDLSTTAPDNSLIEKASRASKGSGKTQKNKNKGGSPQSSKKNKAALKGALPTKKSTKSYLA
ncbi:hypothetical protein QJS04_geneDACA016795 [Acorus gramineus]|uniref:DUF4283 domain-containing protein n=1 Tax=Acorus gramineus TaxID=55184 RepID=A0AAV9BH35_ACOGR|nr:hypothetical protein QJS04_geneDACA016795 [Acorus gramineus]